MKSKTLIALLLALLMLGTMAIPVLAVGKQAGQAIFPQGEESGHGAYILRVSPDNDLTITIYLIRAKPNQTYYGNLWWNCTEGSPPGDSWGFTVVEPFVTDEKGNCFYTATTDGFSSASGPITFCMMTLHEPGDTIPPFEFRYTSNPITVTFNPLE